jgi:hypothetical protein
MSKKQCCSQHGDELIKERGGPDMPTIYGRLYCPSCQRIMNQLLDDMDKKLLEPGA